MAELTTKLFGGSGRATRSKQIPKVDLTTMVDLAFLLITFFMLTTTLSKSQSMDVVMPVDSPVPMGVSDQRTMTVCLGSNDRLLWYRGLLAEPVVSPSVVDYERDGIKKALARQADDVFRLTGKKLMVLVKPSDKSTYRNLVDILDELKISKIASYAIVDISGKIWR